MRIELKPGLVNLIPASEEERQGVVVHCKGCDAWYYYPPASSFCRLVKWQSGKEDDRNVAAHFGTCERCCSTGLPPIPGEVVLHQGRTP
jgi:hypothetical protein